MVVTVRIGTSFISIDQARLNIDTETHTGKLLEDTVAHTRAAWTEKLDRFKIEGATEVQKKIFWTGVVHALQVRGTLPPFIYPSLYSSI